MRSSNDPWLVRNLHNRGLNYTTSRNHFVLQLFHIQE